MSATEATIRLAEARAALHKLLNGERVTSVRDPSGREVQFTQASNVQDLRDYIRQLEAQVAGSRRGPFGVEW